MQDFEVKRNALFACLDGASKDIIGTRLEQKGLDEHTVSAIKGSFSTGDENNILRSLGKSLVTLVGKDSIFKKPELPIAKCIRTINTPDFQVNPHKWKKYSLSEVDISDKMNTSAALRFFKEMEDKRFHVECTKTLPPMEKIVFKQLSILKRNTEMGDGKRDEETEKPKLKGSTLIMPEYVVGLKKADNKKRKMVSKAPKIREQKELKLSHLQEED